MFRLESFLRTNANLLSRKYYWIAKITLNFEDNYLTILMKVHFKGTRGSIPTAPTAKTIREKVVATLLAARGKDLRSETQIRDFVTPMGETHLASILKPDRMNILSLMVVQESVHLEKKLLRTEIRVRHFISFFLISTMIMCRESLFSHPRSFRETR